MKTKISKLVLKEHILNGHCNDPLLNIYVVVTYQSQIIKQFKYKAWKELPLSIRDFITDPDTEISREWDNPGVVAHMHCTEYNIRREAL